MIGGTRKEPPIGIDEVEVHELDSEESPSWVDAAPHRAYGGVAMDFGDHLMYCGGISDGFVTADCHEFDYATAAWRPSSVGGLSKPRFNPRYVIT